MNGVGLWEYAVTLYARDGVKTALLGLQQRRGADVNLMIFCCWCACSGRGALDEARLDELDAVVAPWRAQVTAALRGVRNAIGKHGALAGLPGAGRLRERVLQVELDAERVTLEVLEGMAPAPGETMSAAAAAASLGGYCRRLRFCPDAEDEAALCVLLEAAFSTPADTALRGALRAAAAPPGG